MTLFRFFLLSIVLPSVVIADYVLNTLYTGSTCSGDVNYITASYGDLGVADGCTAVGPNQYLKYFCLNSSYIMYAYFSTPTCTGSPIIPLRPLSLPFGCSSGSGGSLAQLTSCEFGTFTPANNTMLQTSYSSTLPCSSISSGVPPSSIQQRPLDVCILVGSNFYSKNSYNASTGNFSYAIYSTSACSGDNPLNYLASVGCVTASSTVVTSYSGIVAPSMTPSPSPSNNPSASSTPTPSVTPSNLPLVQQIYVRKDIFASSTCSGPALASLFAMYPACDNSTQPPYSFSYVCSGGSAYTYAYSNTLCAGQPFYTNNISSPGCNADSYGSSTTQCGTGQVQIPTNSLVSTQYTSSLNCQDIPGSRISYITYPLGTCIPTGSGGSQLYSCSSSSGIFSNFSNPTCNGPPDTSTVPLRVCSTSGGNSSSIISCTGQSAPTPTPSPSPGSSLSPTPTPSLSIGSSPSTTPTFLPSTTPINSQIASKYTQVSECGYISKDINGFTSGVALYACFTANAKLSPVMSVLIYNPLFGSVSIFQIGYPIGSTSLNTAFAINTTDGLNSITSSNEWISLGNITCTTNDNPSGICGLQFQSTTNITMWLTVYRLSEVIANDSKNSYTIIGIAAGGGFFLILILCGALHAFRIIKVPCFNVCCDRRPLNQKTITTYPIVVTGGGGKGSIQGAGV